jgi:hypothetical protein
MLALGWMIELMGMGRLTMGWEQSIPATGKTTGNMVMGEKKVRMELFTKDNSKTVAKPALGSTCSRINLRIQEM